MQFSKYKFLHKLALLLFYLRNRDVNKLKLSYKSDGVHILVVNALGYSTLLKLPIKIIE
jgi:hypothetical protein